MPIESYASRIGDGRLFDRLKLNAVIAWVRKMMVVLIRQYRDWNPVWKRVALIVNTRPSMPAANAQRSYQIIVTIDLYRHGSHSSTRLYCRPSTAETRIQTR